MRLPCSRHRRRCLQMISRQTSPSSQLLLLVATGKRQELRTALRVMPAKLPTS